MDMENILNLVKEKVSGIIGSQTGISEEKKETAIDVAVSSVTSTLKGGGGISSLLNGGSLHGIEAKVENAVESALTSKAGLKPEVAGTVTAKIVAEVRRMLASAEGSGALSSLVGTLKGL